MTTDKVTTDLSQTLNWKLLSGFHDRPGPDGGSCIIEAAAAAAGFKYRAVFNTMDLPTCFSRIICRYAVNLNDSMNDFSRQKLLPFALRLHGTSDTWEIEYKRAEYLALETVRSFAPLALFRAGLSSHAEDCTAITTITDAKIAIAAAESAAAATWTRKETSPTWAAKATTRAALHTIEAIEAARKFLDANFSNMAYGKTEFAAGRAADAAQEAAWAIWAAKEALGDTVEFHLTWDHAIAALEGALAIGNQADPLDMQLVIERLERAKAIT